MNYRVTTIIALAAILSPLTALADKQCLPGTTDISSIVPEEWTVPGDYKLWVTNCGHYVFNYAGRPEDTSFYDPDSGNFYPDDQYARR